MMRRCEPAPADDRGMKRLPSGREVWWSGKVAIGLRYQPERTGSASRSAEWIQQLLLEKKK